ncbi:DUF2971 domain-containing protein [Treponema primitia]|uniref:DUF2971 domain-containing protein n=1 Tax=Treponema primitia TaxID=88058 RepID=UPI003980992B
MWSHYANQHNGYCLIFNPCENIIYQNPLKRYPASVYTDGRKEYRNPPIPYKVEKVEYKKNITEIDAFDLYKRDVIQNAGKSFCLANFNKAIMY